MFPPRFPGRCYDKDVVLDTKIFDVDDYYKEGNVW